MLAPILLLISLFAWKFHQRKSRRSAIAATSAGPAEKTEGQRVEKKELRSTDRNELVLYSGNPTVEGTRHCAAAEAHCSSILAEDPESIMGLLKRAEVRMMLRAFDNAIADCKRAAELDPSWVNTYMCGNALR